MSSPAESNFNSAIVGQQIIELNVEVYREVKAGRYQRAADLRDQREALQHQLNNSGDPVVIRNVKAALDLPLPSAPLLTQLEQVESKVDPELLRLISTATLPPRWLVQGIAVGVCRATLAKQLNIDSLESPYFRALVPVFSSATFRRSTIMSEWVQAAIRETARTVRPVIWIAEEPAFFAERGVLDIILQFLLRPYMNFVICLGVNEETWAMQFANIPDILALKNQPPPAEPVV